MFACYRGGGGANVGTPVMEGSWRVVRFAPGTLIQGTTELLPREAR